ncbi:MAG TPA: FecR domain-containing protein [Candidatus Polarisedimenticolia bacterium]|nr:FecR domain-containing protein [Candidatus Polarisedimenticolia bacterium]
MTTGRQAAQGNILLDWFTVSYRSIVLALVFLVGAGGAVFLYFYLKAATGDTPEGAALQELTRAERLFSEAESAAHGEQAAPVINQAGRLLESARRTFRDHEFEESRGLSVQSQGFSRKILDSSTAESSFTAKIYRFEGDVKIKRVKQFVWETITGNLALKVGDQIKTSSSGSAQIVYFDGTITTLKPGSLLEIRELFEDPATKVRKVRERLNFGGVHAATQGGNAQGSFHEVSTETTIARTQDRAQMSMEFDAAARTTRTSVESGEAEVSTGGSSVKLASLESVTVPAEGKLSPKENILSSPSLVEPIDQRVFMFVPGKESSTTLKWDRVAAASAYRLQISQQPLFGLLLLNKPDITSTSVVLPDLAGGSYYWRVAARDGAGNEGAFSEIRKFRVGSERERGPEDRVPPALQLVDFMPSGALVIIRGRTEAAASVAIDGQMVDVEDDGAFTAVVKMKHDGPNTLEIVAQDTAGNETRLKKNVYVETF